MEEEEGLTNFTEVIPFLLDQRGERRTFSEGRGKRM